MNQPQNSQSYGLLRWQDEFFSRMRKQGKSLNTLKNYKTDLECFNQYLRKEKRDLDITRFGFSEIEQYSHYLENRYNSTNSKRRRVQALRIFFDYLVEINIFNSNPVRSIPTNPKFLDVPRPAAFMHIKTMWEHLSKETGSVHPMVSLLARRNQIIVLLIYGGAVKVSELGRIKRNQIIIKDEQARIMLFPRKREPYSIPLPEIFIPLFKVYEQQLEEKKSEGKLTFDEIFFSANPYQILGSGLSARGLEVIFKDLSEKLMINITAKSLRQACIFQWLHSKQNDKNIKEWLGVAPSYSLNLYKKHADKYLYTNDFLTALL